MRSAARGLVVAVLAGCAATQGATATATGERATAGVTAARDCPEGPAVELVALRGEAAGEAFRAGGHITALTPTQLEGDPAPWLAGELDVKGTRAFEDRTRALAAESYARGTEPVAMALTLRGRVVATVPVRSAMRGRRFLVRVPERVTFDGDAVDELFAALRTDRRCFGGR